MVSVSMQTSKFQSRLLEKNGKNKMFLNMCFTLRSCAQPELSLKCLYQV